MVKIIESLKNYDDVRKMKNIVYVWNLIEKFKIEDYDEYDDYIIISGKDYRKIYNNSKNKKYIHNLVYHNK